MMCHPDTGLQQRRPLALHARHLTSFPKGATPMTTNHRGCRLTTLTAVLLVLSVGCSRRSASADTSSVAPPSPDKAKTVELMTPDELASLPTQQPDQRIAYGTDSSQ